MTPKNAKKLKSFFSKQSDDIMTAIPWGAISSMRHAPSGNLFGPAWPGNFSDARNSNQTLWKTS